VFYITSTPFWLKALFPKGLIWSENPAGHSLYLTFDDGPHPEITGSVLEQLKQANAKATFFCIGENAERYPQMLENILNEGHSLGNHTQTHPDGWNTPTQVYLKEIKQAAAHIPSNLFRPPYGKITAAQVKCIKQQFPNMQIIMWSCVTGDFDTAKTGKWCAQIAVKSAKPGNIIVFHDSEKAWPRLKVALPLVLEYMYKHGITSSAL
jgi:peptidoglycan/xylan/chitin deacetylase (PgdA/CDA1 family)